LEIRAAAITGTGTWVQWIDNGQPKTERLAGQCSITDSIALLNCQTHKDSIPDKNLSALLLVGSTAPAWQAKADDAIPVDQLTPPPGKSQIVTA